MAGVRLGLLCMILAGMLVIQLVAGDAEASDLHTLAKFQDGVVTVEQSFTDKLAEAPDSSVAERSKGNEEHPVAEAPEIRRLGKHHFHKSVAGGGVVVGGLATAIFAVVFCYIRVTRKRNQVNN